MWLLEAHWDAAEQRFTVVAAPQLPEGGLGPHVQVEVPRVVLFRSYIPDPFTPTQIQWVEVTAARGLITVDSLGLASWGELLSPNDLRIALPEGQLWRLRLESSTALLEVLYVTDEPELKEGQK